MIDSFLKQAQPKDAPKCPKCGKPMVYAAPPVVSRPSWGCPNCWLVPIPAEPEAHPILKNYPWLMDAIEKVVRLIQEPHWKPEDEEALFQQCQGYLVGYWEQHKRTVGKKEQQADPS